jgi:hypothetical protein
MAYKSIYNKWIEPLKRDTGSVRYYHERDSQLQDAHLEHRKMSPLVADVPLTNMLVAEYRYGIAVTLLCFDGKISLMSNYSEFECGTCSPAFNVFHGTVTEDGIYIHDVTMYDGMSMLMESLSCKRVALQGLSMPNSCIPITFAAYERYDGQKKPIFPQGSIFGVEFNHRYTFYKQENRGPIVAAKVITGNGDAWVDSDRIPLKDNVLTRFPVSYGSHTLYHDGYEWLYYARTKDSVSGRRYVDQIVEAGKHVFCPYSAPKCYTQFGDTEVNPIIVQALRWKTGLVSELGDPSEVVSVLTKSLVFEVTKEGTYGIRFNNSAVSAMKAYSLSMQSYANIIMFYRSVLCCSHDEAHKIYRNVLCDDDVSSIRYSLIMFFFRNKTNEVRKREITQAIDLSSKELKELILHDKNFSYYDDILSFCGYVSWDYLVSYDDDELMKYLTKIGIDFELWTSFLVEVNMCVRPLFLQYQILMNMNALNYVDESVVRRGVEASDLEFSVALATLISTRNISKIQGSPKVKYRLSINTGVYMPDAVFSELIYLCSPMSLNSMSALMRFYGFRVRPAHLKIVAYTYLRNGVLVYDHENEIFDPKNYLIEDLYYSWSYRGHVTEMIYKNGVCSSPDGNYFLRVSDNFNYLQMYEFCDGSEPD